MLGSQNPIPTLAVKDLDAARKFYEGKLGLAPAEAQIEGSVLYKAGSTSLFVYPSSYAGTNQATAVTWPLDRSGLESLVKALKGKGVAFEHYEMEGVTHEGDIHVGQGMRIAWFKDPDGNIHALAASG
jgi:catechol 2,3-dioxygenase-like lactoylglutathione lyase family enzyme